MFRTPRRLHTAWERIENIWRLLSESMLCGHPERIMYRLMRTLAVLSAVSLAVASTTNVGLTTATASEHQDGRVGSRA